MLLPLSMLTTTERVSQIGVIGAYATMVPAAVGLSLMMSSPDKNSTQATVGHVMVGTSMSLGALSIGTSMMANLIARGSTLRGAIAPLSHIAVGAATLAGVGIGVATAMGTGPYLDAVDQAVANFNARGATGPAQPATGR